MIRTTTSYASKIEQDIALELEALKRSGEVLWWSYEPFTISLGASCTYKPDFCALVRKDGHVEIQFIECKGGYAREDAIVKLKAAASAIPWARFILVSGRGKQREVVDVPPREALSSQLAWRIISGEGDG